MKKLLIFGAGGHGKVCADCALSMGYKDIEFFDDSNVSGKVLGFNVCGSICNAEMYDRASVEFFAAIGNNSVRLNLINRFKMLGFKPATLVHPFTFVSRFSKLGEGVLVMPGAVVNAGAEIGDGVIINTGARIDHDCYVGNAVHISPGAVICGTVRIGDKTWICAGSTVANNITIGSNCVIAAGSAVVDNVKDGVLVSGTPATVKKELL